MTFNIGDEVYVRSTDTVPGHTGTVAYATETEVLVRDNEDSLKQQWLNIREVELEK